MSTPNKIPWYTIDAATYASVRAKHPEWAEAEQAREIRPALVIDPRRADILAEIAVEHFTRLARFTRLMEEASEDGPSRLPQFVCDQLKVPTTTDEKDTAR